MATHSSSPAPRRASRLRPPATTPPRRITVTGRPPASRLGTPLRTNAGPPLAERTSSVISGMDIDESRPLSTEKNIGRLIDASTFAKSDELTAAFYAHLPIEVNQVLKNAGFYGESFTGEIDTVTGFALVASTKTCFVWQHAQAVRGTPTCYIFSCPQYVDSSSPPLHALVPYGLTREPGLILVSPFGNIRFWDSIGIGLAGGDNYTASDMNLADGEQVTNLVRCDAQTYISSSSTGSLFRLTLTSVGGKYHLACHRFSPPSRSLSFSRLLPAFLSSNQSSSYIPEPGNVSSVALGGQTPVGSREVWCLTDTRVQRWEMKPEGWEELMLDEEVGSVVRDAVRSTFGENVVRDDARMDLELLDLTIDGNDDPILLVSYAGGEEENVMVTDNGIRRIYALVRFSRGDEALKVQTVQSVPYQSTLIGAPIHPRIQLIAGGSLISVQFGDAVALCAQDSAYRDRLELKSSNNRTLGVGVMSSDNSLLVLTASTMMRVFINMDKVNDFDTETGHIQLVKSTLTQAILYGSSVENPLHFSFPPDIDEGALMQGAEQLSRAILESDPVLVRKDHDMSTQLASRKEWLSWLIRFINDNVVLGKMSQRSRQQLATDAEKLYAAHQLWKEHNDFLATSPIHSVLQDVVYTYMHSIREDHHEDIMRAFFRGRISDLGKLVRKVAEIAKHASLQSGRDLGEFLTEANRVMLTILRSALDYREYNLGVYGIELPMIKPWTSHPAVIDVVLELFESTTNLLDSPDPQGEDEEEREKVLTKQLPDMASILFACVQEKLDWLGSSAAATEPGNERDQEELAQKFALLRPEVLETLRRHSCADAAFALAEQYRDFSSLASLCHKEAIYPPETNPHTQRIQNYLDRFKDEFAAELFRWYIHHGELRIMFGQEGVGYDHYLDTFFAQNPTSVSWIQDITKGRHGSAAATLLSEAKQANDLDAKHLMLSIGKLSHLAQLHENATKVDETILDAFHDDLDFVSVQETILEEFRSTLQSLRGRQTIENQVETIVKNKASTLADRKVLLHVFRDLVRRVIQCKTLTIEDAVDVLALKDNASSIDDYATALHLLARAQDIPHDRKMSAFRTVWRRIYLHDNWEAIRKTANVTDAELNERYQNTALYSALCGVLPREHQPEGYETTPDTALQTPTIAEISSRWPGMSPDQVEALVQDYNLECDRLGDLDLNDVYHRVRELAAEHIMWVEEI